MKKPIDVKLTKEGFEKLKADYESLLARRPGVVVRLSAAREQGDLSENAGYHAAKEELGNIDRRLREMKLIMRFADIIDSSSSDTVGLGSVVTVEQDGQMREFSIVGKLEADPISGKVSDISPIGSALMGKKEGDSVEVEIPDGKAVFKIVAIK
jgi:transcription elongation factor GreA